MAVADQKPTRIMEIVMHVIAQLRNADDVSDIDMDSLRTVGYTDVEISTAVSWLVDGMEYSFEPIARSEQLMKSSVNFRSLHPAERHLFSKEAYGDIVQMQLLGIIDAQQLEIIIERSILGSETAMSKDTLHTHVADLLFRDQPRLNGSRMMLNQSRTVH